MPSNLNDQQLHDVVAQANARDVDRVASLVERLSRDHGSIRPSIGEYYARLKLGRSERSGRDVGLGDLDLYSSGAHAFLHVLAEHPAFHEDRSLSAGAPISRNTGDPRLSDAGRDAAELLAAGAVAVALLGESVTININALLHVVFNADAVSTLLRAVLLGKPLPKFEDLFDIPHKLSDLGHNSCVLGVQHALADFGIAAASNRGTSWSTGIEALQPDHGCAGTAVTIRGSGFGQTQPSDVEVWFPTVDGRCAKAQIAPRVPVRFGPQWSDTEIVAVAPANVGVGCVGFVRHPSNTVPLAESASSLAGEMEQCFGAAAFRAVQMITAIGSIGLALPCPPCLRLRHHGKGSTRPNYFQGGPPLVEDFSINGVVDDLYVDPDTELTLNWRVQYATTVEVRRNKFTGGPDIDVTGIMQDSRNIGPFSGSTPSLATYELTATNACGTVTRSVSVRLRPTPALKILGVEVIQAIQHFDLADPSLNNTVRFVARKRTMVRLYIDSGITSGFDAGAGANRQADVTGTVTVWPDGALQGFSATWIDPGGGAFTAKPKAELDRGTLTDTMNFELPVTELSGTTRIEARVWVEDHENEVGTGWYTYDLNTVVTFEPRRTQLLMRILVRDETFVQDPQQWLPAPTAADYCATMKGATTRYPIAEDGFVIAIPPGFEEITTKLGANPTDTGPDIHLLTLDGWTRLLAHVEWIRGGFPPDDREIWTALVPSNVDWPIAGLGHSAWTNSGQPANGRHPCFVAESGFPSGFAHEMGHTFAPPWTGGAHMQIGHAGCPAEDEPDAPGDVDDRLPPHTEDIGVDVAGNLVIPAGWSEIMSYCFPDPRWPSIAFWDLVFDELA